MGGSASWDTNGTDDTFPGAIRCGGEGMRVAIPSPSYGRSGSWALNLWIKSDTSPQPGSTGGSTSGTGGTDMDIGGGGGRVWQYVFSHGHGTPAVQQGRYNLSAFDRNQVGVNGPAVQFARSTCACSFVVCQLLRMF